MTRAGWPTRPCGKRAAGAAGQAHLTAGGHGAEHPPCPPPAGTPSPSPGLAATETATASPASAATAGESPAKSTMSTATPGSCEASGAGCVRGGCLGTSGRERGHLHASPACRGDVLVPCSVSPSALVPAGTVWLSCSSHGDFQKTPLGSKPLGPSWLSVPASPTGSALLQGRCFTPRCRGGSAGRGPGGTAAAGGLC